MIPLSLYVHLPWCVSRCPYCDFNAHAASAFDEPRYVECLVRELERSAEAARGRAVESVFFGGGTPSRFSPDAIRRILDAVRSECDCSPSLEATLEANPQSADRENFSGYRAAGVDRLSLGVQSFDDDCLRRIGRAHDRADARAAIDFVRQAGFSRFNLDIMYGLPGQSVARACTDLETALSFGPEHISWYQLTLEPGTPFAAKPPPLPGEDRLWEMHEKGAEMLERAGYVQYEVSAWCRDGAVCRHNVNYWEYGDYLGVGAGAHGKLTDASGGVFRTVQASRPNEWMAAAEGAGAETRRSRRDADSRIFEFMLGALRLKAGVAWTLFEARAAQPRKALSGALEQARERGLVTESAQGLRASARGWRYLNDLCELFLPEGAGPEPEDDGRVESPLPYPDRRPTQARLSTEA